MLAFTRTGWLESGRRVAQLHGLHPSDDEIKAFLGLKESEPASPSTQQAAQSNERRVTEAERASSDNSTKRVVQDGPHIAQPEPGAASKKTPAARWASFVANQLPDKALKHTRAWGKIFKRWDWPEAARSAKANPILLGHRLSALYEDRDEPIYLILLSMDWTYTIAERGQKFFLDCLQDFEKCGPGEIRLRDTNITINIHDSVEGFADHTVVGQFSQILREDGTTDVLYYEGPDEPVKLMSQRRKNEVVTYRTLEDVVGNRSTLVNYLLDFDHCPAPRDGDSAHSAETLGWAITERAPPDTYFSAPGYSGCLQPVDESDEGRQLARRRRRLGHTPAQV